MWNNFIETLRAQLANQVVAGALALGLVGVAAALLRNLPSLLWGQAKRAFIVTATLDSRNDLFAAFVAWLNDQHFGQRSRWFTVVQAPPSVEDDANAADDAPRLQFSPAPGFHFFWYRGRLMWMQREISMNLQVLETVHLAALFGTRQLMEDLLEGVARHAGERRANRLMLYTVDSWSDTWRLADSKPRRSLDSVALEADVARRLHDDIHEFFSRREWYGRMGVPWRRGYLLYGPPGTGKTSVAYALAGELRLKLCAMSLSNAKLTDAMLSNQLQSTPPRSLILIEDIDSFFNAREKQDTRITISFSGLLNALDGVGAQEGRIIVLTTNHRERLDPALIRPGRIDVEIELGNADAQQLQSMLLRFFPEAQAHAVRLVADYVDGTLSPAQIQKILIAADTAEEAEVGLRVAFTVEPAKPATDS